MQLNFTHFITTVLWTGLVFTGQGAKAQGKFYTVASLREDGYVQVEYTIENAGSIQSFSAPSFKGFKVAQAPFQSFRQENNNGVVSSSQSVTYVLLPDATGKASIEGAVATVDGKTMRSNAVVLQINKKGNPARQQQNINAQLPAQSPSLADDFLDRRSMVEEEYVLRPRDKAEEKIAKNLLVRLDVNKTSCYEGEPVMATYKLCTRLKLESRITKRPSLNGFSVYDMMDAPEDNLQVEKINGKNFNVHIIRRSQLFPLQPGSYELDQVELDNKVWFVRLNAAASRRHYPADEMFGGMLESEGAGETEEHAVTMKSNPVTINVKPLPKQNKPVGFKGAVGKFTIQAGLKNNVISAGDAAQLEVVIEGTGNLPVVNAPDISLPPGMEAFEPAAKENIDKAVYPLAGSKTFDYTFIAHDTGSFTIPAIQFSYFDPGAASYKTISSGPFPVRVLKGEKPSNALASTKNAAASDDKGWKGLLSSSFFILSVITLLLGVIVFLLVKNRAAVAKPETLPRQQELVKPTETIIEPPVTASVPDPLQEARLALHLGYSREFYSEINKAMRDAASVKAASLSADIIREIEAVRRECEIALYTPGYEDKGRQLILEKAEKIIRDLS